MKFIFELEESDIDKEEKLRGKYSMRNNKKEGRQILCNDFYFNSDNREILNSIFKCVIFEKFGRYAVNGKGFYCSFSKGGKTFTMELDNNREFYK